MYHRLNHRLLIPLLAFCLQGVVLQSQELAATPNHWRPAEYRLSGGYSLPHRQEMRALVTGHAWSTSLIWGKHLEGGWANHGNRQGAWQGVEVAGTWGGSKDLGWIVHAIWLNRKPLFGNAFSEFGLGLGWATSPFDPLEAPRSFALGSHVNATLRAIIGYHWDIRHFGRLQFAGGLTHFSNGAVALPNLGINLIGVHLSVMPSKDRYQPKLKKLDRLPEKWLNQGWHYETTVRMGIRDIGLPGGVLHPTNTWMNTVHYRHKKEHNWSATAAVDLGLNQSLRVNGEPEAISNPSKRIQTAVLIGARCHYGRTSLTLMQGWMMSHTDSELGTRHLHTALQHALTPSWGIELGLRSFRLRADSPFLGVVWSPTASNS